MVISLRPLMEVSVRRMLLFGFSRLQQFSGEEQTHGTASVIAALDSGAVEVILKCFLFAGTGADIDEIPGQAGTLFNGTPRAIDGRLEFGGIEPATRDASLHGETDHTGACVFGVAARFIDDLPPAAGARILVWFERTEVKAELVQKFIACRMISWPVAKHECQSKSRKTITAAPRSFAQG
jgi:hypothetical protein